MHNPQPIDDRLPDKMQAELGALLREVPAPKSWRIDAWAAVGRVLTLAIFAPIALWYDAQRLMPGPLMIAIFVWYVTPPIYRAVTQRNAEREWTVRQQAHAELMLRKFAEIPHAQLIARLAEVAVVQHGGRITNVVNTVDKLVHESDRHRLPEAPAPKDSP